MDKSALEYLSTIYNRSEGQMEHLFRLVDMDYNVLCDLEDALKKNFVFSCPDTKAEALAVLSL